MNLHVYFTFPCFFLFLSLACFAQENPTSSPEGKNVSIDQQMTTANQKVNQSTICRDNQIKLRVNESDIEEIFNLMHKYTTHVVDIEVTISSNNNHPKLKWSWASEIGRTIISLIEKNSIAFNSSSSGFSTRSYHLTTLNAGIETANVLVSEEQYGCLPTGTNGSEIVFDFLLHELFRVDEIHDYKLCRLHKDEKNVKQYNCCRIASNGKLTICADYSSIILEHSERYILFAVVLLFLYIGFPLMLYYLLSLQKESGSYEITDSPMALSHVFYRIFIRATKSRAKKCFRRLAFALAVTVIICVSFSEWVWIAISLLWAIPLTFVDIFGGVKNTAGDNSHGNDDNRNDDNRNDDNRNDDNRNDDNRNDDNRNDDNRNDDNIYEKSLLVVTLPLNVKFFWAMITKFPCLKDWLSKESSSEQDQETNSFNCCQIVLFTAIEIFSFVILYPFFVLFACLFVTCHIVSLTSITIIKLSDSRSSGIFAMLLSYASIFVVFVAFTAFLNFALYLVIGFYLNGSFYSPILTPILLFLVYSWRDWRSFVEIQYLQLKTKIYEVCSEPGHVFEVTHASPDTLFEVNIENGTVPEALYEKLREKILPYNRVLFYFFIRMYFVVNFCLLVFVIILLAQKSNISGPVQITSTFVIATLPLLFTIILPEHSSEKKDTHDEKLKQDIKKLMTIVTKTGDVVEVLVECEGAKLNKNYLYPWRM